MAAPVFYQTLNMEGVDPSIYYLNTYAAGGSITPEYPAPPFLPGTKAYGSDASEFIFVQASTSIGLGDFVALNVGTGAIPYQANSVTTTNIWASTLMGIGSAGLVVKQSVTLIPAGAFFWACTKGQYVPATTSGAVLGTGGFAAGAGNTVLYVALTGVGVGILTSVSTTLSPALGGITVISSLSTSIQSSVCPTVGNLTSTGAMIGPVVALNNPRILGVIACVCYTTGTATTIIQQLVGGFSF